MITRLDSSPYSTDSSYEGEQVITPLLRPKQQESTSTVSQKLDIHDYINNQCNETGNRVVAFVINWIKTTYTKYILEYIDKVKEELKQEILKELNNATNR